MAQYHGLKIVGFGFLVFSACSDSGPENTPLGTAGGNNGGSAAVAGAGGADLGGKGGAAGGSAAVAGAGGTAPGGMGGTAGASGGGASGGAGGAAGGSPSGGSAGAENGGMANGGAGGGEPQATSCTPARPHDSGRTPVNIQHDGNGRDYVLFVPSGYDGTEPLPLVLDIHGLMSFATEQLDRSKWDDMGEQENFVVVAPNGIDRRWNAGFGDNGTDDVGFIRAVVAEVASELCIDEKRIYVTGHSNGGAMTHKLGCEAADLFAAMAPICGWTTSEACNPARPMAVAAVRSLGDTTVTYEASDRNPSAAEDLQRWLDADECEDMPVVTSHDDMCTTHTSCKDGTQVMECHPPGQHNFFYATDNLLVPDTVWPFFKQFTLP